MNYTIVDVSDNKITIEYNGKLATYLLPIVGGLYPVGADLDAFIKSCISISETPVTVGANLTDIQRLVVAPTLPLPSRQVPMPIPVVKPAQSSEMQIRGARARLLANTDWTQMPDAELDVPTKGLWAVYRTELRATTSQPTFPTSVIWPIPPALFVGHGGAFLTDVNGRPQVNYNLP